MSHIINLNTDASYKEDTGFALAYYAKLVDENNEKKEIDGAKFVDKNTKSTDAEVLAIAYGIIESYKQVDKTQDNFIQIHSDCEHAVKVYNQHNIQEENLKRTVYSLLNDFDMWSVRWVPRNLNKKANNLAKEELLRAENND